MTGASHILESLEAVSAKIGDPTPHIYRTLFERHPELEELFLMDQDGSVRGSMLQQALECVIGHVEGSTLHPMIVSTSRINHDGYGVPGSLLSLSLWRRNTKQRNA